MAELQKLAKQDAQNNISGVISILENDQPKENIIQSVIQNVFWQMDSDRKSTALKNLQVCKDTCQFIPRGTCGNKDMNLEN